MDVLFGSLVEVMGPAAHLCPGEDSLITCSRILLEKLLIISFHLPEVLSNTLFSEACSGKESRTRARETDT